MKIHETELTMMPSKTFHQGTIGDEQCEQPIHISYFTDVIELEQIPHGRVLIMRDAFEAFVKSVRKGLKEL